MRILVHEYVGHPFAFQLSDELCRRGHDVLHLYCARFPSPKAIPGRSHGVARVEGLKLPGEFRKYSYFNRRACDIAHGRQVGRRIRSFKPDLVISSTTPLDAQRRILKACQRSGSRFVYWLQDLYGIGITERLRGRWLGLGALIGFHYRRLECRLLRRSDAVVTICDAFADACGRGGVAADRCHVIRNWAPLAELVPSRPAGNWARAHGLDGRQIVLYAGTIGLKHDPALLLSLARHLAARPSAMLVVVSEGLGADYLNSALARERIDNLRVLPFQPYDVLGDMLAAADVTLATLNAEAGAYSVPSKITSYLSAGRPIVISAPRENLATEMVLGAMAGLAVGPGDGKGMADAVSRLLDDETMRRHCGANGRRFAETAFDIEAITDRFETIFTRVIGRG